MNIKTLDRTIRSMQKNGYFNLTKGKISFGYEEYIKMKEIYYYSKGVIRTPLLFFYQYRIIGYPLSIVL